MTIVDQRYAAELVTDKGKVYKFDAIECLINYQNEHQKATFAHILVSTYNNKTLTDAAGCSYLRSENLPSPMGMYITAVSDKGTAEELRQDQGGQIYSWEELKKNFNQLPVIKPQALH
ncbi:lipoprotein, putative [Fulvivirga imtechensis AK7]|uniref:Lipoprotein, putative n=2 Tax=Fulvivirga TaxID=396811 RepID=L8JTZ8_9BACT|nr:lipoprotein, putative [Fulvivirga imtechensis AK7]